MKKAIFLLVIFVICFVSYGKAFEFYFWKDDWAWLWSSNYNPDDFFHSTVGSNWIARTGLFMHPYVLLLHKIIRDSSTWQVIGFLLKYTNSILSYFFIYSFTKKKNLAVLGAALFASYSGGIESYTWHKLNAFATSFILIGFTFFNEFLGTQKIKLFVLSYVSFVLAMFSYMGRSAGIAMVCVFFGILTIFEKNITTKARFIILTALLAIFIPYLFLVKWVSTQQLMPPGYFVSALQNSKYFFGIVGNLLKNPFIKANELGYLADLDKASYFLGYLLFIVGGILSLHFLVKRNNFVKLYLFFVGWIFLFYFPNWIYGGGGILTFLSSGHRYLSVSGIGVVMLWIMLFQKVKKIFLIIPMISMILINIIYSNYLINLESSVRNKNLVEPIYHELSKFMEPDKDVQLVIIDVPNFLASFIVGGWYPYTYAYYKGLTDVTKFPVVISRLGIGIQWACAKSKLEKQKIASIGGFSDNQNLENLDQSHVYAWKLNEKGELTNITSNFRSDLSLCGFNTK